MRHARFLFLILSDLMEASPPVAAHATPLSASRASRTTLTLDAFRAIDIG